MSPDAWSCLPRHTKIYYFVSFIYTEASREKEDVPDLEDEGDHDGGPS